MPKYKKRKDGRYLAQIQIGYQDNGKPKYKNLYGRTISDLDNKIVEFKSNLNKGIIIDDKNLTVKQWSEEWLKTYKSNLKPNTYAVYENCLNAHFKDINDIKLKNLRIEHIQKKVNELSDTPRAREIFLMTVNQMLNQAIKSEYIYKNVATNIKLPKRNKPEKRALTDTEINDILSLNIEPFMKVFISIMLYAGLRRGETWALTKNDINLKDKTIEVNKTVHFNKNTISVGTPKSQAANRTIKIPDLLYNILKDYVDNLKTISLFCINGEIMTPSQFKKNWEKFIAIYNSSKGGTKEVKAIASDITPHIFRHTYATLLYNAGVDVKTAQYLLGHASISMTLDIYTHLQKGKDIEAVQKLNSFISQKSVKQDAK